MPRAAKEVAAFAAGFFAGVGDTLSRFRTEASADLARAALNVVTGVFAARFREALAGGCIEAARSVSSCRGTERVAACVFDRLR